MENSEEDLAARKPLLLSIFAGCLLLRMAERQLSGLLLNDPPRNTRDLSIGHPGEQAGPGRIGAPPQKTGWHDRSDRTFHRLFTVARQRQPESPASPATRAYARPSTTQRPTAEHFCFFLVTIVATRDSRCDCYNTPVVRETASRLCDCCRGTGKAQRRHRSQRAYAAGGRLWICQEVDSGKKNSRAACGGAAAFNYRLHRSAQTEKKNADYRGPRSRGEQALAARKPPPSSKSAGCQL